MKLTLKEKRILKAGIKPVNYHDSQKNASSELDTFKEVKDRADDLQRQIDEGSGGGEGYVKKEYLEANYYDKNDIDNEGFIVEESDPTVEEHIKAITQDDIDKWNEDDYFLVTFSGNADGTITRCSATFDEIYAAINAKKRVFARWAYRNMVLYEVITYMPNQYIVFSSNVQYPYDIYQRNPVDPTDDNPIPDQFSGLPSHNYLVVIRKNGTIATYDHSSVNRAELDNKLPTCVFISDGIVIPDEGTVYQLTVQPLGVNVGLDYFTVNGLGSVLWKNAIKSNSISRNQVLAYFKGRVYQLVDKYTEGAWLKLVCLDGTNIHILETNVEQGTPRFRYSRSSMLTEDVLEDYYTKEEIDNAGFGQINIVNIDYDENDNVIIDKTFAEIEELISENKLVVAKSGAYYLPLTWFEEGNVICFSGLSGEEFPYAGFKIDIFANDTVNMYEQNPLALTTNFVSSNAGKAIIDYNTGKHSLSIDKQPNTSGTPAGEIVLFEGKQDNNVYRFEVPALGYLDAFQVKLTPGNGVSINDAGVISIQSDFFLYDFTQNLTNSVTLRPIIDDTPADTNNSRVDVILPSTLENNWKIISIAKYECYSGTTRVDAIITFQFSMNQQKTIRLGLKTTGSNNKTIDKIQGALLLAKR